MLIPVCVCACGSLQYYTRACVLGPDHAAVKPLSLCSKVSVLLCRTGAAFKTQLKPAPGRLAVDMVAWRLFTI